jgi:outer membrane protein assembly factor BamD (BamD/ComL family)
MGGAYLIPWDLTGTRTMKKTEQMMIAYDKFVDQIARLHEQARKHLLNGEYEEAQRILARITTQHARSSLSLRNYLITSGRIKTPK